MQALRFACLPTLSVLCLMFFAFFSIEKTLDFIGSSNGWAVTIRILLFLVEILLVWYMYEKNCEEMKISDTIGNLEVQEFKTIDGGTNICDAIEDAKYRSYIKVYKISSDISIIKLDKNKD